MGVITGDSSVQTDVLESLSDAVNYRRWLTSLVRPHLGSDPIEIGSGLGDYAQEWADDVERITVTEADPSRYELLRERFTGQAVIHPRQLRLPCEVKAEFSAVVAINVLEHIPAHVAALVSMARLVRDEGRVIIIVPAFPSAMSRFDRLIGHERRYTTDTLSAAMTEAGIRLTQVRYLNPLGLLNWYLAVKFLGVTPQNGPLLRIFDRTVIPLTRALEQRFEAPFGQSVLAVGQVPCRQTTPVVPRQRSRTA